jgi:SRSO17 transposase
MEFVFDAAGQIRLEQFFAKISDVLNNKKRRESFAMYTMGLLGSCERKSVEPLAAAATGDPDECDACHQRLLHFLAESKWSDRGVRGIAARHAIEAMSTREEIQTWIIDDTGFLKQGKHSVGVQRQYTGSAGKIANCQIGVSLSVANSFAHVPIDFELYLPEEWTSDKARRKECKIPDDIVFKSKEELALDMIERAVHEQIPGKIVLADSWYGRSSNLRTVLRVYGFDYALGIPASLKMRPVGSSGRTADSRSAQEIAEALPKTAFRRVTWRQGVASGARGKLHSRFAFRRVLVEGNEEPEWLIVEWPEHESAPTHFALTTLARHMSKKEIIRIFKERYRTERVYEEMKNELGLDHFEGRSFIGWHHHVSVAICCYAFVVGERMRHFSPAVEEEAGQAQTNSLAA